MTGISDDDPATKPENKPDLLYIFHKGQGNESASNYAIKLKSENISVDEVIVTAMGIKRSEKSLGYSAAKVSKNYVADKHQPFLRIPNFALAVPHLASSI